MTVSTLGGFGLVAAILARQLDPAAFLRYGGFMLSSVLLGLVFLSLAVMVSVFAADRTRASGLAIMLWFFFVLVFDLLLVGALVISGGSFGGDAFSWLLIGFEN